MYTVTLLPSGQQLSVAKPDNLLAVLRRGGIHPDAPCGGNGTCGKCRVVADGAEVLACQTAVDKDMTVTVPQSSALHILQDGTDTPCAVHPEKDGSLLAFDIGTTSVVCFLLDGKTGMELAKGSILNPQTAFGADVISRLQSALGSEPEQQTTAIRTGMTALIQTVCTAASIDPNSIRTVSLVGNPAMQQLFLGICPENLVSVPFAPVLTEAKTVPCGEYLPICSNAELLIVPDISGYIGADTMGCILSTGIYKSDAVTLLVDIGTNGEMVLGNKDRMVACSAAAGPALEGANIRFGMRGMDGAIDHVWLDKGNICCSVIGGGKAMGICGSGILDAIAVGLESGLLNKRGRIQTPDRCIPLTDGIYLTQEDIRQVQLAKGAIHAGILLMTKHLGISLGDIQKVQLAGAFGSYLNPESACRIGLLPAELRSRIEAVGNAAGSGAKMLARDDRLLPLTQALQDRIEFLELASLPEFSLTFARSMLFQEEDL